MTKSVVWLDHQNALVFNLTPGSETTEKHEKKEWDFKAVRLHEATPHSTFRMHSRKNKNAGRFSPNEHNFYEAIEGHLKGSDHILVLGPGFAKVEFVKHALKHVTSFAEALIGVETVDHPSENDLAAFTRDYFELEDKHALDHLKKMAHKHSAAH